MKKLLIFLFLSIIGMHSTFAQKIDGSPTIKLSEKSFDSQIKKGVILVDFWAVWCGPCRKMAPTLDKIAIERRKTLRVGKVNVEDYPKLAERYDIQDIPVMILFKNGREIFRFKGVFDQVELEDGIDKALSL